MCGTNQNMLSGAGSTVHCILVHPLQGDERKQVVVGCEDGSIHRWDLDSRALYPTKFKGHKEAVTALLMADSGELLSSSTDKTVRAWNLTTGELVKTLSHHTDWVRCMTFVGDTLYTGGNDSTIMCYSSWTADDPGASELTGHKGWVTCFAASEGTLYSGSYDKSIRAWNGGRTVRVFRGHGSHVRGVCLVGDLLFSASRDEAVFVWSVGGEVDEGSVLPGECLMELHSGLLLSTLVAAPTGPLVIAGTSSGEVFSINTAMLKEDHARFLARNSQEHRDKQKFYTEKFNAKVSRLKARMKKVVKLEKKRLLDQMETERVAEKAAKEEGEEDGGEEGKEEEDKEGEEETAPATLGEERMKLLEEFQSQQEKKVELETQELQEELNSELQEIAPILKRQYTQTPEKLFARPYVMRLAKGPESVLSVAVASGSDGSLTLFRASGAVVTLSSARSTAIEL